MDRTAVAACSLAFSIGVVAGMRSMTAPAAVAWAVRMGGPLLSGTWLAFFGLAWTPWILTLLAAGKLVVDTLPSTPSRKAPGPFGARILIGALCGAALAVGAASMLAGATAGMAGAVAGTLGGYAFRARMAAAFGADRPAALLEDALCVGVAIVIALAAR